jgi:hypothetical protein
MLRVKQSLANCKAIGVVLLADGLPSLRSLGVHLLVGGSN